MRPRLWFGSLRRSSADCFSTGRSSVRHSSADCCTTDCSSFRRSSADYRSTGSSSFRHSSPDCCTTDHSSVRHSFADCCALASLTVALQVVAPFAVVPEVRELSAASSQSRLLRSRRPDLSSATHPHLPPRAQPQPQPQPQPHTHTPAHAPQEILVV